MTGSPPPRDGAPARDADAGAATGPGSRDGAAAQVRDYDADPASPPAPNRPTPEAPLSASAAVPADSRATAIRDAATVIVLRRVPGAAPRVLMGMRGAQAAFMASKYVFPGGAVDPEDAGGPRMADPDPRLAADPLDGAAPPHALIACAARELAEETGLALRPQAAPLFVFRAITPPGRSRRFDARFFVIDAADLDGDLDDFSRACDELSHLHWVALPDARALDLPFITEVVLAEVESLAAAAGDGPLPRPEGVPFFDNRGAEPRFVRLA